MSKSISDSNWHSLTVEKTFKKLEVTKEGLSDQEVLTRQNFYGFNKLQEANRKNKLLIFIEQFNDILIFILIIGALTSIILAFVEAKTYTNLSIEHFLDAIVIVIVLLFNALIGFYQEIKAEKEVSSLKSLITTESIVIRNKIKMKISQDLLVPGDIIEIEAGQKVPADARLIEVTNLQIIESSLTGESVPVEKVASKILSENVSLADRINMIYMGTTVSFGKGLAIITAIGDTTEIGKIVNMVASIESSKTPLQQRLETFGKQLGIGTVFIAIIMVIFGFFSEYFYAGGNINILKTLLDLTIIGVSLVIAAVPEGLPAVMVLVLALGIQRMAKQNTISKSLQAIESIGSTTFICTDKTGTLTLNKMIVTKFVTNSNDFSPESDSPTKITQDLLKLLTIADMANSAVVSSESKGNTDLSIGDPLDIAIKNSLVELKKTNSFSIETKKIIKELPFDSSRKRMSVVANISNETFMLYTKGAPDLLLDICTTIITQQGQEENLTNDQKQGLLKNIHHLSSEGLKVIGCGYRTLNKNQVESTNSEKFDFYEIETNLTFVGFICLIDPPRPEVFDAIKSCKTAGIDVLMMTGDHPSTALAIGKQINLVNSTENKALTGSMINELDDNSLLSELEQVRILARVTPDQKLRVVKLLQTKGQIVAMTGDGVNDAPALRQADIGVAMGITGTEAASEASDLILTDDNFATLVNAIEEGRSIQANIRKFIGYLLASNTGEVLLLLMTVIIVGFLAPSLVVELTPLNESQILYMNLVTDTFLAIAIGLEKKSSFMMNQPPPNPFEPIITKKTLLSIMYTGTYVSIITLLSFMYLLGDPSNWTSLDHNRIAYAQTVTMTLLIFMETFIALSYRSTESILSMNIFSNRIFILSFVLVYIFHLFIIYIPFLRILFNLVEISIIDFVSIIFLAMVALLLEEFRKFILKQRIFITRQP